MSKESDRPGSSGRLRIAAIGLRGVPSRYSGLETSAQCLYRELARREHDVTVYCRPRYLDDGDLEDGDQQDRDLQDRGVADYHGVHRHRLPSLHFKPVETLSHVGLSFAHSLVLGHYDLLHTHALAPGLFAWLRRVSNAPIVSTIQGLDWQRTKWKGAGSKALATAERLLARYSDELIVVSRDLQQYFLERYRRRAECIPNGVDRLMRPPEDTILELLACHGLQAGRYVVYMGRLVPEKRIEDLILAFRNITAPYRLAIVGEGGYTSSYVDHLKSIAAFDSRVVFTGLLRGHEWATVCSQAAAFVSPSEIEGLPMAVLETMELGVPAVISDIPPHRELLGPVDGYDLFFEPGAVDHLRARLERALSSPSWSRQIAQRAQQHVRLHFAWPRIAERTEQVLYRALMHGGRSRRASAPSPRPSHS